MWIIVVFIMALGAGTMTYRAATDYRTEPAAPSVATTPGEAVSSHQIDPAVRPSAGHGPG